MPYLRVGSRVFRRQQFLAAHWDGLAAADFFTVKVLTMGGLVRYVVLFIMKLKTRTVEIAGITSQPDGDWMTQVARNLTDAHDGFLRDVHDLILDRDPLYTAAFRDLLRDSGVKPLRLPARSPKFEGLRFILHLIGLIRGKVETSSIRQTSALHLDWGIRTGRFIETFVFVVKS